MGPEAGDRGVEPLDSGSAATIADGLFENTIKDSIALNTSGHIKIKRLHFSIHAPLSFGRDGLFYL
ncbi:hypothetical protein FW320_02710 [Azospirillum sp. Vi22]|uniref:hypothetical protein n=1 Tax=Azospirillum TaxID=191 RepID=UPI0011AFC747|nr:MULTISPECIES: hypothetical protein [Azospirillum]NUB05105.1 hypothetical protein [Azospirillum baldaniorum]